MQIAVIGGSGDLGRAVTPHLLERGHTVISVDRSLPAAFPPPGAPRPQYLAADARDFGEMVAALRGCEAVLHLAAHRSPGQSPDHIVYAENTTASYNVLSAAATLGIKRVALASSINAIGGAFSRRPRYDYFPVDEHHPTYAEDPYSLSKWVLEQQGDAFARRFAELSIASLRFHWLLPDRARAEELTARNTWGGAVRHLWAYTTFAAASRACELALTAGFSGHEVFYIVAPQTAAPTPSLELARTHYPETPIRGELSGHTGFFDCRKAERLLGWRHED